MNKKYVVEESALFDSEKNRFTSVPIDRRLSTRNLALLCLAIEHTVPDLYLVSITLSHSFPLSHLSDSQRRYFAAR